MPLAKRLHSGHYPPIYQPPEAVYLLNIYSKAGKDLRKVVRYSCFACTSILPGGEKSYEATKESSD